MKLSRRQTRYARALFEEASGASRARPTLDELKAIKSVIDTSPDLVEVLGNPHVAAEHREDLVRKTLGGVVGGPTLDFLAFLAKRGHVAALDGIVAIYEKMLLASEGISRASVTTAVPISDEERAMVLDRLQQLTGNAVELTSVVDPVIVGGLVIRVGDRVIDGSIRYHLERMRENLKQLRLV